MLAYRPRVDPLMRLSPAGRSVPAPQSCSCACNESRAHGGCGAQFSGAQATIGSTLRCRSSVQRQLSGASATGGASFGRPSILRRMTGSNPAGPARLARAACSRGLLARPACTTCLHDLPPRPACARGHRGPLNRCQCSAARANAASRRRGRHQARRQFRGRRADASGGLTSRYGCRATAASRP